MIYWELFFTFLQIGAVCFGGGYAMIPLIRDQVVLRGWLTEGELLNMIAVSESTPGPIAVNMATFVGSSQGGVLGAMVATLGVVIPSFFVILIIAALIRNLLQYQGVQAFLRGIRPCVVGLILSTAVTLLFSTVFGITSIHSAPSADLRGIAILILLAAFALLFKMLRKKKPSPILMIFLSAGLGVIFYGA